MDNWINFIVGDDLTKKPLIMVNTLLEFFLPQHEEKKVLGDHVLNPQKIWAQFSKKLPYLYMAFKRICKSANLQITTLIQN